ncbi:hypothetical protein Nizo2264_2770 [Lactiplantibacillus plantarum]|nr:hypothetical protein Nizo2264_2770 [Lactiplantibacillus plantarum]
MITDKYVITNHLQEILDKKKIPLEDFVKYATAFGLSRAVVYKIAADVHYSMKETISHKLGLLLDVPHDELITWSPNMKIYLDDDLRGFSPSRLKVLSDEMSSAGVDLQYQVYSRNGAMNVTTRYAQNRRMYLDGNFRIDTNGLPELWLISFDVINNRIDTTPTELRSFQYQLLRRVVNFAEKVGIYRINYFVTRTDSGQHKNMCVSAEETMQICKELGFKESTRCGSDSSQLHFVKTLLSY